MRLTCPRCGLAVSPAAPFLTLSHCPRCLAQARISVPMFDLADTPIDLADVTSLASLVIRTKCQPGRVVFALEGELDLASAPVLQQQLDAARAAGTGNVVVDLSGLEFIDSTGLQLLLYADRRLRSNGQSLFLRRGPRSIQRLLELTHAVALLRFED